MTTTSNAVLPSNQTTKTSFLSKHQLTLMTLAALVALLSGVVAIRIWFALNHIT